MGDTSDNNGGHADPEEFIEPFEPGLNDFSIEFHKIFPPRVKGAFAKRAYLIKLRLVLHMPAEDWKYFTSIAETIRSNKMFCGIWTPQVGEVIVDDYGCYFEMISYLKRGTEDRLVHLDRVISTSPRFGTGTHMARPTSSDERVVRKFVERVKEGHDMEEAIEKVRKEEPEAVEEATEEEDEREGELRGPNEDVRAGKYVIGHSVVVQGGIVDRLYEAEKKLEHKEKEEE